MIRAAFLLVAILLAAPVVVSHARDSGSSAIDHPIAVLRDPIDRRQAGIEFGERSHWLQPWRAYLDTVPATRLAQSVGINFNVPPESARSTARLLARAGFRRARIEVGWAAFSYSDPERLNKPAALRTILRALQHEHIRPLILLNANDLKPCPTKQFETHVVESAERGARSVRVDRATASEIVPGRSGLTLPAGTKAAGILFTSVAADGVAQLSKPLPEDLPAGSHPATTLLFEPFARPRLADGRPNPRFERTLAGWLRYVDAVAAFARRTLGSTQFDLEIWNELSFGSDFLDLDRYYDRRVDDGRGDTLDAVLRRTVSWLRQPERGLAAVGIGDGFASQRPWDSGARTPAGLTAIDKHPYPSPHRFPGDAVFGNVRPLDALGRPDGIREGERWQDRFVPRYTAFLPEYALTAIQTETLVRDLSPFTTKVYGVPHGRFTHPEGGRPPQVWITESNLDPGDGPSALTPVERHLQAKSALRALVAYVNKGVHAFFFYAAQGPRLGLIDPRRPDGGETIAAIQRLMRGFDGAATPQHVGPLRLLEIGDFSNTVQFAGDGSAAHPPLYDRDVLAFLPFQVTDRRFVAAAYVMTRDVTRPYRPRRFRLTIGGVGRCGLPIEMSDPLLGSRQLVRVVACSRRSLTVDVRLTDSPRLLQIG